MFYGDEREWHTDEIKLLSSPANSTPVGPPPTTTICSSRDRSSCVRAVNEAKRLNLLQRFVSCRFRERKLVYSNVEIDHDKPTSWDEPLSLTGKVGFIPVCDEMVSDVSRI